MGSYAVVEENEGLARALRARFGPACAPGAEPDLLVISPAGAGRGLDGRVRCGAVLLPGTAGALLRDISSPSAVSYGLSPRDTITLSSREGERFCVAVQRELVTAEGTVLERQELVLRLGADRDALQALALAGAVLLLGGDPERERF